MQIKDILPRLRATSRTFRDVDYKMSQGYRKNYELAKKYSDYELHPLTEKEIIRVLNSHSDEFSKKNWALSILRMTLNYKISSNTRQESKMTINQRITRLEEAINRAQFSAKIPVIEIQSRDRYDNSEIDQYVKTTFTGAKRDVVNGKFLIPYVGSEDGSDENDQVEFIRQDLLREYGIRVNIKLV